MKRTESNDYPKEEKKLKLKNLSSKQKRLMEASAAGGSGIALGALSVVLMGFYEKAEGNNAPENLVEDVEGTEEIEVPIYTSAPFSEKVEGDMSFQEAFSTAREDVGPGGFFEWDGQTFNTYYKDEWDQLSKEEKTDFTNSINQEQSVELSDISDADEILQILNDLEENESIEIVEEDIVILDEDTEEGDIVVIEEENSIDEGDEESGPDLDAEIDELDDPSSELIQ